MVASKAPTSRHYSSTGNLQTRVNCAVAQKLQFFLLNYEAQGDGYLLKILLILAITQFITIF